MGAKRLNPHETGGEIETRREQRPDHPLSAFLRDMSKMIDGMRNELGEAGRGQKGGPFVPLVDLVDAGAEFIMSAELPGMNQDEIDVSLLRDRITLKGEKKSEREKKGKGFHLLERSYGGFERSIPLPAEVNADKTHAVFRNGVLTITLPKAERALTGARKVSVSMD